MSGGRYYKNSRLTSLHNSAVLGSHVVNRGVSVRICVWATRPCSFGFLAVTHDEATLPATDILGTLSGSEPGLMRASQVGQEVVHQYT